MNDDPLASLVEIREVLRLVRIPSLTDEEAALEAGPARTVLEGVARVGAVDPSCLDCLSHRELIEFAGCTDSVKTFVLQSLAFLSTPNKPPNVC